MIAERWHRGQTFSYSIFNDNHIIANVVEHGVTPQQRDEYANLIAAAPKMLAALKAVSFHRSWVSAGNIAIMDEAIAEAQGGQHDVGNTGAQAMLVVKP